MNTTAGVHSQPQRARNRVSRIQIRQAAPSCHRGAHGGTCNKHPRRFAAAGEYQPALYRGGNTARSPVSRCRLDARAWRRGRGWCFAGMCCPDERRERAEPVLARHMTHVPQPPTPGRAPRLQTRTITNTPSRQNYPCAPPAPPSWPRLGPARPRTTTYSARSAMVTTSGHYQRSPAGRPQPSKDSGVPSQTHGLPQASWWRPACEIPGHRHTLAEVLSCAASSFGGAEVGRRPLAPQWRSSSAAQRASAAHQHSSFAAAGDAGRLACPGTPVSPSSAVKPRAAAAAAAAPACFYAACSTRRTALPAQPAAPSRPPALLASLPVSGGSHTRQGGPGAVLLLKQPPRPVDLWLAGGLLGA